jgi:hypothetical protein
MIIPTDGGLRPGDAKWLPMQEWLAANHFDLDWVPTDALIEIRDGSCLGVEVYERGADGKLSWPDKSQRPPTHIEWHPLVQAPPPILLPEEVS